MIIFETQEAFDSAVMAAVRKHLSLYVNLYEDCGDVKLFVELTDDSTGIQVDEAKDYCTVSSRPYDPND